ncbi:hypothetical protein [Streptomyces sp. C10]|uniref:hypothetical protein n=1 Tax=Streptomyces sp. C10 TaxID=531941 RepID=UPI00397EB8D5
MTRTPGRSRRSPHTAAAALTALSALLLTTLPGCGIASTGPVPAGEQASGIQQPGTDARSVRLYFADPHGIRAVSRPADRPLSPQKALDLLLEGPTSAERKRGLISQVPPMAGRLTATTANGAVDIIIPFAISSSEGLDVTAVSQIACTAAHAEAPGARPATQVDIRIHENNIRSPSPWTIRCAPNGYARPVTS